jgi:3-hydroxyisobutyrate dehydrogenase-like beta-hydroxyacid dehydrogenase
MEKLPIVAFIGLGNMGYPMAINLLNAGYVVYGVDVNKEAEQRFSSAGGKIGTPIPSLAQQADIILTSLPTAAIVEEIFLGNNGIIKNAHASLLAIDFSTVPAKVNEKISLVCRDKNIGYLGAPVSGGVIGAENATLTIMVGGPKVHLDAAYPLLTILGKNIFHNGENPNSGTIVKLLNNLMVGFYNHGVAEVILLGERMGVNLDMVYDNLSVSYGQSRMYERNYKQFIANNNFKPGFTISLLLKDLKIAKEMAEECGAPLPIGYQLIEYLSTAVSKGFGNKDMSSIYLFLKEGHTNMD